MLESRLMRAREDVVRFEGALECLASAADAEVHLVEMHLAFDDAARHPEVMYGLVHLLESFDVTVQVRAFVEALERLYVQAPEWMETLLLRLIGDEVASAELCRVLRAGSSSSLAAAKGVLARVIAANDAAVAADAQQVLDALE
nr:Imm30 family immunity protein [Myxococcus sp. CA040A]